MKKQLGHIARDLALLIGVLSPLSAASSNQNTKMLRFETATGVLADFSTINGSSAKLTRSDDGVSLRVNTTELKEGAYTIWWVIFNNPEACVDGCNEPDLFVPGVMATVFFATGGVVGKSGVGHFNADLQEGELPSLPGQVLLPGGPLLDARKAEIHVVIKYHGPLVVAIAEKQLGTHYGGCSKESPAQPLDPVPADRMYPCYDPQLTVFPAP